MRFIYIVLIFLIITGCKKAGSSTTDLTYPSTYNAASIINTSPVRLFTKNGEITTATMITSFVKRYDTNQGITNFYLNGRNDAAGLGPTTSLTLHSSQSASLTSFTGTEKTYNMAVNAMEIRLTGTDVSTANTWDSSYSKFVTTQSILKYKPASIVSVPAVQGFVEQVIYDKFFYLDGNDIKQPLMNYICLKSTQIGSSSYFNVAAAANVNNWFDETAYLSLGPTDTLAVQQFALIYKK